MRKSELSGFRHIEDFSFSHCSTKNRSTQRHLFPGAAGQGLVWQYCHTAHGKSSDPAVDEADISYSFGHEDDSLISCVLRDGALTIWSSCQPSPIKLSRRIKPRKPLKTAMSNRRANQEPLFQSRVPGPARGF